MKRRKQISYLIFPLMLILGILAFPATASAAEIVGSGYFGETEENLHWSLDSDGVVTISGKGSMGEYCSSPWEDCNVEIKKVIIKEGVTSIAEGAFTHETTLETIELPDSINVIDDYSFYNCKNLQDFDFPKNLQTIGENAFYQCESLTNLTIPQSVKSIGTWAFLDCEKLKKVIFLGNPEIGSSAFDFCHSEIIFITTTDGYPKKYAEFNDYTYINIPDMEITEFYLKEDLGTTSATLTWKRVPIADAYRVYKYNSSTKSYRLIDTLSSTKSSYKITGLKSGSVYQYKIDAYVKLDGKTYTTPAEKIKFRTRSSSSSVKSKNNKIADGYGATIKTVTKTYTDLDGYTNFDYSKYSSGVSDICQFTDNKDNYCVAYSNKKGTYIWIRAYDKSMKQVYSRKIKQLYPFLGTVVCDDDGYFYIVWGNPSNSDKPCGVTMAVSKYKKDGTLVKTYKKTATTEGSAKRPFVAGNCDAAWQDDLLVCNYAIERFDGHQSNDIMIIDTKTMTNAGGYSSYVSHAFDQRVLFDKDDVAWFVNHGDGYPRGFNVKTSSDKKEANYNPFHFYAPESAWNDMFTLNRTNARLGGVVETSSGLILVGSSVKSLKSSGYKSQKQNLFIMYADPAKKMLDGVSRTGSCLGESVTDKGVKWLTNYTSYDVENPQVVYTDNDRIVVLWEKVKKDEWVSTYYMILSSNGKILQKATKIKGVKLNANEEPIYKDGYVFWSTSGGELLSNNKLKIHRLSLSSLTFDNTSLKVKGLKVSSKTKSSVSLKWDKVSNADGYRIYKYNSSKKKYVEVKTIKSSTLKYTVKNLSKGKNYTLAVKAYKKINGKTYWSDYTKIKVKTKS